MEESREVERSERREEQPPQKQPPQKSSGGFIKEMLIYIIAMVIMTVIAVVVVTVVIYKDNTEAAVTATPLPTKTPQYQDDSPNENDPIYTIEDIVVNTADIGFPRLLKVKIHIIFREINMRNNFEKSEVRQAQIKELLIMTFSSKTAEELKKNEIMKELKDYLRDEMNLIFGPDEVKKVYISEYFVQ